MKGKWVRYSEAELAWIEGHAQEPRAQAHAAFCLEFGRSDVTLSNFNALCKRNGWLTGRTGCFEKGQVSWNAGKKCEPGRGGRHPNAKATQFKKGSRSGIATKLYKPVGTERVNQSGYLERKIHDGMPLQSRWRAVHLLEWEKANGPLPKGMALKCLDGDRLNTAADNWVAIPRALLPRLNGRFGRNYDDAPPELKPAILAIAKLEHAAREHRGRKRSGVESAFSPSAKRGDGA